MEVGAGLLQLLTLKHEGGGGAAKGSPFSPECVCVRKFEQWVKIRVKSDHQLCYHVCFRLDDTSKVFVAM